MKKRTLAKPDLVRLFLVPLAVNLAFSSQFNTPSVKTPVKTPVIEQLLHENQIAFETQLQAPPTSGNFPKDIIVRIPAKDNLKNSSSPIACASMLVDQGFCASNISFLLRLIDAYSETQLPYDLQLILPAADAAFLPDDSPPRYDRISSLIPTAGATKEVCALIVSQGLEDTSVISLQAGGNVCPQWLAQTLHRSCTQNAKPVKIERRALYFHKSGVYKENPLLAHLLEHEIPALQITLSGGDDDIAVLSSFLENLTTATVQNTSYRYAFVDTWPGFWINEAQLTFLLIVFCALVLLFVCFISFSSTSKNEAFFKDVARSWFVPLCHVLLCAALLHLFQTVFDTWSGNEVLLFGLKLVPTLFSMFLLIFVQSIFDFRLSLAATRFNSTVFCAFNVVFFSSIDLSLIQVFLAEFVIVALFSHQRNFFLTVFCVVAMIFPFSRIFISIFQGVEQEKITPALIRVSFAENLALAFLMLPFLFQWTKLVLLFTRKISSASKRVRFLRGLLLSAFAAVFAIALFISFALPLAKTLPPPQEPLVVTEVEPSTRLFRTSLATSGSFDLARQEITIMPVEGFSLLRCRMEVSSKAESPVLDCNFGFTLTERGHTTVQIPDCPSDAVRVVLNCPALSPPLISVSVFAADDTGEVYFASQQFSIEGVHEAEGGQSEGMYGV